MIEHDVVPLMDIHVHPGETDETRPPLQALRTVAKLQKAAGDQVTVMIPGEWRRATPATQSGDR